jgi:hypothetical protein
MYLNIKYYMKCVHIYRDGKMDEINLIKNKMKISLSNLDKHLNKISKSQGNNNISELYSWNNDGCSIKCYSWYDGEPGFENKHDLPPGGISTFLEEDSSSQLLFGDIFLVKIVAEKIIDFQVSDYGVFYNLIFDGFDNCDTGTDSEDINIEEEDANYENEEKYTDDEYEIISDCENELDIDGTEY